MVLLAVALLTMTATFAENEKNNTAEAANVYSLKINNAALANALQLDFDQADAVEDIHKNFAADLMNASTAKNDEERKTIVDKAVKKDLSYMRAVLSRVQYRKYLTLLNATLANRGILK